MYTHILVATDGSDLAAKGVRHGLLLAKALGARTTVVVVAEFSNGIALTGERESGVFDTIAAMKRASESAERNILDEVCEQAKREGVACEPVHVFDRVPADGILDTAAQRGCDLIVMASHGRRGMQRVLLGSKAFEIVTRAKVPVLIVR